MSRFDKMVVVMSLFCFFMCAYGLFTATFEIKKIAAIKPKQGYNFSKVKPAFLNRIDSK